MSEFKFEITKHIGILSENPKGWTKELNLVSWNDREAKYDIRDWSPEHDKMGKGVTLSDEEFDELREIMIEETYDSEPEHTDNFVSQEKPKQSNNSNTHTQINQPKKTRKHRIV